MASSALKALLPQDIDVQLAMEILFLTHHARFQELDILCLDALFAHQVIGHKAGVA
jgi:hypothetical protein